MELQYTLSNFGTLKTLICRKLIFPLTLKYSSNVNINFYVKECSLKTFLSRFFFFQSKKFIFEEKIVICSVVSKQIVSQILSDPSIFAVFRLNLNYHYIFLILILISGLYFLIISLILYFYVIVYVLVRTLLSRKLIISNFIYHPFVFEISRKYCISI